jgi:hypothetical protein
MLKSIKFGIGATALAAAQLASAGVAEVTVSNITLSVSGGDGWYYLPVNVNWLPTMTAGTSTALVFPAASDAAIGWHGSALASSVTEGSSLATATLTDSPSWNTDSWNLDGVSASAHVIANDGQIGWAFAKIFDGQILVGGKATITLSATINGISASGSTAQANAYMEMCSTDFVTDVCDFANSAEAFVDGVSGHYGGPAILTASWTNPGDQGTSAWAKMRFGLTASAESLAPVPEPATWALALAGLGLVALRKRSAL